MTNLAGTEEEVIRYTALLRGTESAWQAVSYGLTSLPLFGEVGAAYINFGLWGLGVWPAWLVLKHFGAGKQGDSESRADANATVASSETQSEAEVKGVQDSPDLKPGQGN